MPTGFHVSMAFAVGALMAISASIPLPPVVSFGLGLVAVLLGFVLDARLSEPQQSTPDALPASPPEPVREPAAIGHALIEKLPAPLLVISRTGRVTAANPAAHAVLPRLEPNAHFASLIRAPAFVEAVTATLAAGREHSFEFTTHQGRERFFEARTALLPSNGAFGPEAQAIVQIEDRTETRRAEELRSDFIANASHELRTPLASIIGYIETLQHHARDDAEARERFLGIMGREAGRMQRLVDDLMWLSRIEMIEHVRPVEERSLNRIAAESASALLPLAQQHEVRLLVEVEPDGAEVRCDHDQLSQVFANIIDNAIKYGGRGSTVRILGAAPDKAHPNRCGVTITDDGPGISRQHIHRLTERFYRANVPNSRSKGGTGLGLAIVKHILNRHEGRLEVVSEPGEGSAFTVWLPRAAPRSVREEPPPGDKAVRRSG